MEKATGISHLGEQAALCAPPLQTCSSRATGPSRLPRPCLHCLSTFRCPRFWSLWNRLLPAAVRRLSSCLSAEMSPWSHSQTVPRWKWEKEPLCLGLGARALGWGGAAARRPLQNQPALAGFGSDLANVGSHVILPAQLLQAKILLLEWVICSHE